MFGFLKSKTQKARKKRGRSVGEGGNDSVECDFDREDILIGLKRAGNPYSLTYVTITMHFDLDSEWRMSLPDLRASQKDPVEPLAIVYYGKKGLYRTLSPEPTIAWSKQGHSRCSKLFQDVIWTCLLMFRRRCLSSDLLLMPLSYLCDYAHIGDLTSLHITFSVELTADYPVSSLVLRFDDQLVSLFTAKWGFAARAIIESTNVKARRTLVISQNEEVRSDS